MADYRLSPDRIQYRQATTEELALLTTAEAMLLQLRTPLLLETPRDRVFISAMDGTGNSIYKDVPGQFTVVGRLKADIEALNNPSVIVGYVEGIYTQNWSIEKLADGPFGVTFNRRVEQAYFQLCVQASNWLRQDPDARIHLVTVGFSRGAEATGALQRTIHERGIRDPTDVEVKLDPNGLLRTITYANLPPLVPPGRTAQVALLIDPVATGLRDEERRFPASNVSTLQITSVHERRDLFPSTRHVPDGLTEGGRVANLLVPGSHTDVAGAYQLDGIGRRVDNMYVDVLNTMFGQPLLQKRAEAIDPRLYAIHRSEQHLLGVFSSAHYSQHGERQIHSDLAPACKVAVKEECRRDPADFRLIDTLQWRHVERGRAPGGTDDRMEIALAALDRMYARNSPRLDDLAARAGVPALPQDIVGLFKHLVDAAERADDYAMTAVANAYLSTPAGQGVRTSIALAQGWTHAHAYDYREDVPHPAADSERSPPPQLLQQRDPAPRLLHP